MDAAGAGGGDADTQPPGELRVSAGGERRRLLVPHLDEAEFLLLSAERLEEAVDAVAGVAEDDFDAPVDQSFDEQIRCGFRHGGDSLGADGCRRHPYSPAGIAPDSSGIEKRSLP